MPLDPLPPRACRANQKYTFSEDETDEERSSAFDSPDVAAKHLPLDSNSSSPFIPPHLPRTSHTRKRSPCHIRRPRNAFIIFRSEFCDQQRMSSGGIENDHRQISRIAGHIWNNLPEEQKAEYRRRAEEEAAAHKAAYPDYRYAPVGRPRAVVRHKIKRSIDDETLRCRKVAELFMTGMKGKELDMAIKTLNDKLTSEPITYTINRASPKRPSIRKRKDEPLISALKSSPSFPERMDRVKSVRILCPPPSGNTDDPLAVSASRSRASPYDVSHLLKNLNSSETMEKEPVPSESPQDAIGVMSSPDMGFDQQESLMVDPSDPFSFSLCQLFATPPESPDSSSSILSYFAPSPSTDADQAGDLFDTYSETPFSIPSDILFPESGDRCTTSFETQIMDAHFRNSDMFAYDDLSELEKYVNVE